MTNPTSYTDEQVLKQIQWCEWLKQDTAAECIRSLFADRQRLQAEVETLRRDCGRYFQLRDNPEDRDVLNTGMPWVVRVERINGVPTMNAIYGPELDFELDAARATPNETKEAKS